jgi:uncharacterized membrane protein
MNWWYAKGDQKTGPIDDAAFRAKIQDGTVLPDDLVWNEGMATWSRAGGVPGLFGMGPVSDGTTHNRDLMALALKSLSGQWGLAIGVVILLNVINQATSMIMQVGAAIPVVGVVFVLMFLVVSFIITGATTWGSARFFLGVARGEKPDLAQAFSGFSHIWKACGTIVLIAIYTMLWMLLLIVPGIIKGLSYSMTWYVLVDNPDMGINDAIDRSRAMMDGMKWKLFCLQFRFLGWVLLSVLTCFIGLLWVIPYMQTSLANFYGDVKGRVPASQVV